MDRVCHTRDSASGFDLHNPLFEETLPPSCDDQRLPFCVRDASVGFNLRFDVLYTHRTRALTDKDSVLLADFVNTTSEPVFDGTLKQALAVQLQQSPFLSIVPEQRVARPSSSWDVLPMKT
jgi:hypothetical protein